MQRPVIYIAGLLAAFAAGHYIPLGQPADPPTARTQPPTAAASTASLPLNAPAAVSGKKSKEPAGQPAPDSQIGANDAKELLSILESLGEKRDMEGVERTLAKWMAADPDAVIAFLSASANRDGILIKLTALWAKQDPAAASSWLAGHRDRLGHDAMVSGLVSTVVREEPEAAVKWVSAMKDPLLKAAAAQDAGYEFYRQSDDAAGKALTEMGLPESASPAMFGAWEKRFAEFARRDAQNIASVFNAARAAGAEVNAQTVEDIRALLSAGIKGSGAFSSNMFKVDTTDRSPRETAATVGHLEVSEGTVKYLRN